MLNVLMLNVVALNVNMVNVVMLNVVALLEHLTRHNLFWSNNIGSVMSVL